MATIDLNDSNFRETYTNNDIVFMNFWAIWCGPCQQFKETYDKAAETHSDTCFGRINIDEELKLAQYFGVRSVPTVLVIRQGIEVYRSTGGLLAEDIAKILDGVKKLNMDDVIKKLEEEEKAQTT